MPTSDVTFSIIVPTVGRHTLTRTLAAVAPQLEPGDEILVLCDQTGDWGNTPRNSALTRCAGTHLLFIDDDDHHTPNALATIRAHVVAAPDRIHLFAMQGDHTFIPTLPPTMGAVGTPMICVPNQPDRLGRWSTRYEGDYDFLVSSLRYHELPICHSDIVAVVT